MYVKIRIGEKHLIVRSSKLKIGIYEEYSGIAFAPHYNENPIYVFLLWELRGHSPNFHIHVSVSDLYMYSQNRSKYFLQQNREILSVNIIFGIGSMQCMQKDRKNLSKVGKSSRVFISLPTGRSPKDVTVQ